MWWFLLFILLFAIVSYWPTFRKEGLQGQEPQNSAEALAQLEMNSVAIDDLNAKIKELQASGKRIDELENKINGTVDMLKSVNEQCSKTS
jgi:hypothetical protein